MKACRIILALFFTVVLTGNTASALDESEGGSILSDRQEDGANLGLDGSPERNEVQGQDIGFNDLDLDEDGSISREEWKPARTNHRKNGRSRFMEQGPGREQRPRELDFRVLDRDRSGSVTWDEYLRSCTDADEDQAGREFDALDGNLTMDLTREELEDHKQTEQSPSVPFLSLSEYKGRRMDNQSFEMLDEDGNNVVTWDEFNRNYPDLSLERLQKDFETMDRDENGQIDNEEWSGIFQEE
ncbi:MAG: EF-hand domain-containing protein [Desulfovibrionales bacterium]